MTLPSNLSFPKNPQIRGREKRRELAWRLAKLWCDLWGGFQALILPGGWSHGQKVRRRVKNIPDEIIGPESGVCTPLSLQTLQSLGRKPKMWVPWNTPLCARVPGPQPQQPHRASLPWAAWWPGLASEIAGSWETRSHLVWAVGDQTGLRVPHSRDGYPSLTGRTMTQTRCPLPLKVWTHNSPSAS